MGKLTLRGVTKDLRLPLTIDPHRRRASSSRAKPRSSASTIGVGQGDWESTECGRRRREAPIQGRAGRRRMTDGGLEFHAPRLDGHFAERRDAVVLSRRGPAHELVDGRASRSPSSSCSCSSRWFLTWELRKRGEALQITDEGVLRRLARGDSEFVRWSDLREVSIVMTQGVNLTEEYFYVLAGTGTSGVIVGQALATKYDLLSHLAKLPGFDHRQHRRGDGVAGEPALHAVARGAARRRSAWSAARAAAWTDSSCTRTPLPSLRVNITAAHPPVEVQVHVGIESLIPRVAIADLEIHRGLRAAIDRAGDHRRLPSATPEIPRTSPRSTPARRRRCATPLRHVST